MEFETGRNDIVKINLSLFATAAMTVLTGLFSGQMAAEAGEGDFHPPQAGESNPSVLPVASPIRISPETAQTYRRKHVLGKISGKLSGTLVEYLDGAKGGIRYRGQFRGSRTVPVDGMLDCNVHGETDGGLAELLEASGCEIISESKRYGTVHARIPVDRLKMLAEDERVLSVREVLPPRFHRNTSEGDAGHRASAARAAYGVTGKGIKVGVMSDSEAWLAKMQQSGDLPAGIEVVASGLGSTHDTGEGTAMMEIVYDLAPDAALCFASAVCTEEEAAERYLEMFDRGCRVLVDDITFPTELAFSEGPFEDAIREITARGGVCISSAGNDGNDGGGFSVDWTTGKLVAGETYHIANTWEGDWTPSGERVVVDGETYELHKFPDGLLYNALSWIQGCGGCDFRLEWSDPGFASGNDYDLAVCYANGTEKEIFTPSAEAQIGEGSVPVEFWSIRDMDATVVGGVAPGLAILKKDGAEPRRLRLTAFSQAVFMHNHTPGHTYGHNGGERTLSVGGSAVPPTGEFSGTTGGVYYSSDGPRRLYHAYDGSPCSDDDLEASGGRWLAKPDILAATEVSCATPPSMNPYACFDPFGGTSASAPHAAAIVALMLEANPALDRDGIFEIMKKATFSGPNASWDRTRGYGILDAEECVRLAAESNPYFIPPVPAAPSPAVAGTKLLWDAVPGARYYRTYRSTHPYEEPEPYGEWRTNRVQSIERPDYNSGDVYFYYVKAASTTNEATAGSFSPYQAVGYSSSITPQIFLVGSRFVENSFHYTLYDSKTANGTGTASIRKSKGSTGLRLDIAYEADTVSSLGDAGNVNLEDGSLQLLLQRPYKITATLSAKGISGMMNLPATAFYGFQPSSQNDVQSANWLTLPHYLYLGYDRYVGGSTTQVVDAAGGSLSAALACRPATNVWRASVDAEWVHLFRTGGNGSGELGFLVEANDSGGREARISVKTAKDEEFMSVTIIQEEGTPAPVTEQRLTFDPNGGTCSVEGIDCTVPGKYGTFPTPTWPGHAFKGWFTEPEGGERVKKGYPVTEEPTRTLWAHWEEIASPTITGLRIEGSAEVEVESEHLYTCIALWSDGTEEYVEAEWGIESGGEYGDIDRADGWFAPCSTPSGGEVVIRATYQELTAYLLIRVAPAAQTVTTQTLVFNPNGGTCTVETKDCEVPGYYPGFPTPTWPGHAFKGWFTDPEGGKRVKKGYPVTEEPMRTLWAHWEEIAPPTITGLRIEGAEEVEADSEYLYSCLAIWSDGTEEYVEAEWDIESGGEYGGIDRADGWFWACSTPSGGEVVIRATYQELTAYLSIRVAPDGQMVTSNDDFDAAESISGVHETLKGCNDGATMEEGEPTPSAQEQSWGSVWFKWMAPESGVASFDTFGSSFDTVLGVWTGNNVSSLEEIDSSDDVQVWDELSDEYETSRQSQVVFDAVKGTLYRIAVYGFDDGLNVQCGDFTLSWTLSVVEKVRVTFESNGGTACEPREYTVGDSYGSLPEPTKEGCTFDGWYSDPSCTDRIWESDMVTKSLTTLYAHWTEIPMPNLMEYKPKAWPAAIYLAREWGSTNMTTNVWAGETAYLNFCYANFGTGAANSHRVAGVVLDAAGNAVTNWNRKEGRLGINACRGVTNIEFSVAAPGLYTVVVTLDSLGSLDELDESDNEIRLEFTAKAVLQTVHFDATGGTSKKTSVTCPVGGTYSGFPACTWENHVFQGWYDDPEGGRRVKNGMQVTADGERTLYAHWKRQTVRFDANGGTSKKESVTCLVGGTYSGFPACTWENHVFQGWYDDPEGGSRVKNGMQVTADGERTLYAHWKRQTVHFDANGGTCKKAAMQCFVGGTYTSLASASWDGRKFLGWFDARAGGTRVKIGMAVTADAERTLYAHWEQTVHFDANGGTSKKASVTCVIGETYTTLATASRAGHTFQGWYDAPEGGTRVRIGMTVSSDRERTLYAHWMAKASGTGLHISSFTAGGTPREEGARRAAVTGSVLTFEAEDGCVYELQWAPSLDGEWTTLRHWIAESDGKASVEVPAKPGVSTGFYRLAQPSASAE